MEQSLTPQRDIFLSHSSKDKEFVRKLATDIELEQYQSRKLLVWLDEAEIRPGQSITHMVNAGLENSRFIGLVLTPNYFQSDSGWTDAEWHAALFSDPDNRKARVIPLLAESCPYIPPLLRHLKMIDLRGEKYTTGLKELLKVLRNEPLPRPVAVRGQLVAASGEIDRATLLAERAVPDADPDVVNENLYCNLLPIIKLPEYVYVAPISSSLYKIRENGTRAHPTKQQLKDKIMAQQMVKEHPIVPAFRVVGDHIFTFHDLESPDSLFTSIIDDSNIESIPIENLVGEEEYRNIIVSLLNMALDRHAQRVGLVIDKTKQHRFFFPPKDGSENIITWTPHKKNSRRSVAKPCFNNNGKIVFWIHQGAYLQVFFLANKFYLKIEPTRVLTEDGHTVKGGPSIGSKIIKWTGAERNLQILYHICFWTYILKNGPGLISIKAGDQWMTIDTVPAFVQQAYGIANDRKKIMEELDEIAEELAQEEESEAQLVTQLGSTVSYVDEFGVDDAEEEDDDFIEDIVDEGEPDE